MNIKKFFLLASLGLMVFASSCSSDDDAPAVSEDNVLSGDITTSRTLTADKIWLLRGNVFVTNNSTLTIEPGTIIKGEKSTKGSLIITRGARINAAGTVDKPIVFTSNAAAGGRSQGDWGGVILLGKANNNIGASVAIEGISDATDKAKHGGTDDADNSGVMKYVRIEFAGIPLGPDNEINGLTFGSVGSGTTIDHIEVYRSGDDAYEWFGGSVNAKYLLSIATWDDDFDTDNGYSGKIQFALAQRLASTADVSGSNGFESDNNSGGTSATPQTKALFSNVTILGPREHLQGTATSAPSVNANYQNAAQIRRNSAMSLNNSVLAGYTVGVFYDDALGNSSGALTGNTSLFLNNLIYGCTTPIRATNATALQAVTDKINAGGNAISADLANALYTEPYKFAADLAGGARIGTPVFTQKTGSVGLAGAAFTGAYADAFFDKVAFKGAFGAENWAAGWAHFDPQNLPYTTPGAVK
ncbi:hypothetical protein [uncultured Mucilaginibacter sp.]|uniref:hypothetical protein n=1 Tax=uncultured Mucilaginibacter sp. TaxID=797541 RepID=UPI0025F35D38|nr:hypothetical protein [uncultured Mucilaginibacter sp.]